MCITPIKSSYNKSLYYYAHIPKTGGTSFTPIIDRFFSAQAVYPANIWSNVNNPSNQTLEKYSFVRGHFGGGGIKQLTDKRIKYLTILRDPNNLLFSTYNFIKRKEQLLLHNYVNKYNINFEQFLEGLVAKNYNNNRMIRFLSFDFKKDPFPDGTFLNQKVIDHIKDHLNPNVQPLNNNNRFKRAKKIIDNSFWFGLLEQYNDSIRLLCYLMKWPPVGQTQILNSHNKTKQFSNKELQLLNNNNKFDYMLYDYAIKIFNIRFEEMVNHLEEFRTNQSETIDKLLDNYYQSHDRKLSSDITYNFDQVLMGSGWHRRQPTNRENDFYRWTGPSNLSTIDFWVKNRDYTLEIEIINTVCKRNIESLNLFVNGHKLNIIEYTNFKPYKISAKVPAELIKQNGLLRLSIYVNILTIHKIAFKMHNSRDERVVGIAVRNISLY